jgi:hypothetical protein
MNDRADYLAREAFARFRLIEWGCRENAIRDYAWMLRRTMFACFLFGCVFTTLCLVAIGKL